MCTKIFRPCCDCLSELGGGEPASWLDNGQEKGIKEVVWHPRMFGNLLDCATSAMLATCMHQQHSTHASAPSSLPPTAGFPCSTTCPGFILARQAKHGWMSVNYPCQICASLLVARSRPQALILCYIPFSDCSNDKCAIRPKVNERFWTSEFTFKQC